MHIKVDEDLPLAVAVRLRSGGYLVSTVVEQGMGGWKDPVLWKEVQLDRQFLVTADKGFGDIRQYPPGTHAGVLVLRPDEDGIRPLVELLERVLAHYDLGELAELVTVVSPRSIRIRRAVP
jgi:hypothetical protein